MYLERVKSWYLTVDKTMIALLGILTLIGMVLVLSTSPSIAAKLNLPHNFFFKKHIINLIIGIFMLLFISNLSERGVLRFSLIAGVVLVFLLVLTPIIGMEIKGARRWLNLFGFTMQPSEFLKPFYVVIMARILSLRNIRNLPSYKILPCLHLLVVLLLLKQPDLGMTVTYTVVFLALIFISGIHLLWLPVGAALLSTIVGMAYLYFPHVSHRINSFLMGDSAANYQVDKSLDAYLSGGLFGQGPMGGNVKAQLPDCHTDFIFAVAGEEFGAFFVSIIILLISGVIIRALIHATRAEDEFKLYTISGIAILYAFQSIFNIGVTLNLLPTKGMTLPFISYGGSSTISFMIAFGILLNFTKRNLNRLNIHATTL